MKTCTKCRLRKPATDFPIRRRATDGLDGWCRSCKAIDQLARYHNDLTRGRAINRRSAAKRVTKKRDEDCRYAARTKDRKRAYDRARREGTKDQTATRVAAWKRKNRDRVNAQTNAKRRSDPTARLAHNIGVQMRHALHGRKDASWRGLVGYTAADLKAHLASLLDPTMTWANYGSYWHIDHRRPISTFQLPEQTRECWALSNLQPLHGPANISKGARWNGHDPRCAPRRKNASATAINGASP